MKVFNTLTRQKEEFVTLEPGKVKMFACGPTVYYFIHIGYARPLCVFDVLRRYLEGRVSLRPLIWCGKNSMFLMATHLPWYIAPVLVAEGKRFYTAAAPDVKYFLVMLAEFAALMAIEFVMVRCKDRIKDAITGGGKEKAVSRAIQYL